MIAGGYHGRCLVIDADSSRIEPLDESTLRNFLGGVGLGTRLLAEFHEAGTDPLGPDAALVIALSPLVGSPLTTSAKFAIVAISPLTGRVCDALCSSRFAIAAKAAGIDALVIRGGFSRPIVLTIDGYGTGSPRVAQIPAGEFQGRSAAETEATLKSRLGPGWEIAAIGPAGERLVPFATISHDGRHAGRGGLGAVLGAKRIKAIAIRGDRPTPLANRPRVLELARDLARRAQGPETARYRELGTVSNLELFQRLQVLPSHNFQAGGLDDPEPLLAALAADQRIERATCAACAIGCEHRYPSAGKPIRLEYETVFAIGPLCGVNDPDAMKQAAARCDELGLDTISTGGTIAFLMECAERGWIEGKLNNGRALRFGDPNALLGAIDDLVQRRGPLGELLALGSRNAAEQIGPEALAIAPQVKGLELPGYHPSRLHAMALGLATGTRGADHNRSGAYEADFRSQDPSPTALAHAATVTEDRAALLDSLVLCKFLRGVFDDLPTEAAAMIEAVTGRPTTADDLRQISQRVVNARKCLNQREGWTYAEDTLPARLLNAGLTRDRLNALIAAYYQTRGWDQQGQVPPDLRQKLGLDDPRFGPATPEQAGVGIRAGRR